jgi:hypothetical protein
VLDAEFVEPGRPRVEIAAVSHPERDVVQPVRHSSKGWPGLA